MEFLEENHDEEPSLSQPTSLPHMAFNAAPIATLRHQISDFSPIIAKFELIHKLICSLIDPATWKRIRELLKPFTESMDALSLCMYHSILKLGVIHGRTVGWPNLTRKRFTAGDVETLYDPETHTARLKLANALVDSLNQANANFAEAQSQLPRVTKQLRVHQAESVNEYTKAQRKPLSWIAYFDASSSPPGLDPRSAAAKTILTIADELETCQSLLSFVSSFISGLLDHFRQLIGIMGDPMFLGLRSLSTEELQSLNDQRRISLEYIRKIDEVWDSICVSVL